MSYATTQRFAVGETTVDIPFPQPGYKCVPTRAQNVLRTWGGDVRVADRNVTWYVTEMVVRMTTTEYALLLTFWHTTAKASYAEITWTDINETVHSNARFLGSELPTTNPAYGVVDVMFRIRTAEMVY